MPEAPKTFQEMHRERQRGAFVGRSEETQAFEENLGRAVDDPRRRPIVAISGQGGMGKTTFMAHCRELAVEAKMATAWTNEEDADLVSVMSRIADDLADKDAFSSFLKARDKYLDRRHSLEAHPEAPQDLARVVGSAAGRAGTKLARRIPLAGAAFDFIDDEAMGEQMGEVAAFVIQRTKQRDEARLILEPVEVLTPLFLEAMKSIMEKQTVGLFLDAFEETRHVVEPWLLQLLDGQFGPLPLNFLIVIAGRFSLSPDTWASYEGLIERIELHPLSQAESRDFLARKGMTAKETVEEVVNLAQGVPIFLVSLTIGTPDNPQVADTAVERVLRSVSDPLRKVAIRAALPRLLNRDLGRLIIDGSDADASFDWLVGMPFVQSTADGWKYHNVIRHEFLRYGKRESPEKWLEAQSKLAEYYKDRRNDAITAKDGRAAFHFEIERAYHRICVGDRNDLAEMIGLCLRTWELGPEFARPWAASMRDAEEDSGSESTWGRDWIDTLDELARGHDQPAIALLTRLLSQGLLGKKAEVDALVARCDLYYGQSRMDAALEDIEAAIELDGEDPRLIHERAWVLFGAGNTEQALADCDAALAMLEEDDPRQTKYRVMRVAVAKALLEPKETLKLINEVLATSEDPWALLTRGRILRDLGEAADAIEDFKKVAEKAPARRHEAREEIGLTHMQCGRYGDAVSVFRDMVEKNPKCETCWPQLATSFAADGKRDELERLLMETGAEVEDPVVHAFRALGLAEVDLNEAARAELEIAIADDPTNPDFRLWFSRVLEKDGQVGDSLRQVDEALRLRPNWPEALVFRGTLRVQMDDRAGAEDDWSAAERIDPSQSGASGLNGRGLELSILGRYEEAIRVLDRVLADGPMPEATYNRAVARAAVAGADAAREELLAAEKVLDAAKKPLTRAYGKAGLRCVLGDDAGALRGLEEAIAIHSAAARGWARHDPAWIRMRGDAAFESVVNGSSDASP